MKITLILTILCLFIGSCTEALGYNDRQPTTPRVVTTRYCYTTWHEARCFNTYERCAIQEQTHFLDSVTPCRAVAEYH